MDIASKESFTTGEQDVVDAHELGADVGAVIGALAGTLRREVRSRWPGPALPPRGVRLMRLARDHRHVRVSEVAVIWRMPVGDVEDLAMELAADGVVACTPHSGGELVVELTTAGRVRMAMWADWRDQITEHAVELLPPSQRQALRAALPALRELILALDAVHL
jgi:hypothetical protein